MQEGRLGQAGPNQALIRVSERGSGRGNWGWGPVSGNAAGGGLSRCTGRSPGTRGGTRNSGGASGGRSPASRRGARTTAGRGLAFRGGAGAGGRWSFGLGDGGRGVPGVGGGASAGEWRSSCTGEGA